jgi:two-component system chemotaxis sensor kinase CheA
LQALDVVIRQFGELQSGRDPTPAPADLLVRLERMNMPDAEEEEANPGESLPPEAIAAAPETAQAKREGDISDQEFEDLLDALDQETASTAPPAINGAKETKATSGTDDISEEEFEQL